MRLLATAAILSMIAAPALARSPKRADPEAELAKLVQGRTAEAPVSCITLDRNNPSTTIDGVGILYGSGNRLYLNRFRGSCPQLTSDRIIITNTTTSRLCRGDLARIVSRPPTIEYGGCILDDFTPYARKR